MRKLLLLVVSALFAFQAFAQAPYGNEWIHYDRQYWAVKVWADGVKKIDSLALATAGFPVGSVDPNNIQLFARGKQVPTYVKGGADGVMNTADYIEFYGAKNDGWLDSTLWDDPAHINNPFYSLYNDTIRYYITWGPSSEALHPMESGSSNWAAYTPLPWAWGTTRLQYTGTYQTGTREPSGISTSVIGEGEGFFNAANISTTGADFTQPQNLAIPGLYQGSGAPAARYRISLAGLINPGLGGCNDHHLRFTQGSSLLLDTMFAGYQLLKEEFTLPNASLVLPNATVNITVVHDLAALCGSLPADYQDATALAWQDVRYPRTFVFASTPVADVEVPAQAGTDSVLVTFTSVPGPVVYAWASDGLHRVQDIISSGNIHQAVLPPAPVDMRLLITAPGSVLAAGSVAMVNGTGYFTELEQLLVDSAMVIVSQTRLMPEAAQYAAYRETNLYNRHNTMLVDVEELYAQFGGGVRQHPMAIRNFLRYVYEQAPSRPRTMFLLGKSVKAPGSTFADYLRGYRKDPLASAACLVPTIGFPGSDMLYGLNLVSGGGNDFIHVPVGRLAAKNGTEVLDYLAKVDSVESQPPAAWMKNIVHFRGGFTANDYITFDSALSEYQAIAEDTSFFGNVTKFVKSDGSIIEPAASDSVNDLINEGVTLMTFFGHAYGAGFDITIDAPSNYDWHGKFPTIIGNSCYTGNIHQYDASSSSEQFVLNHNAGAIAFISSVDLGLSEFLRPFTSAFYTSFSQVNYGLGIGEHMRYAENSSLATGVIYDLTTAEEMTLHGDPTIVMNSPELPDLDVHQPDVSLIPAQVNADVDTFQVRVIFRNNGRGTNQSFQVALQRTLISEGVVLPLQSQTVSMGSYQDTVYFNVPTHVTAGGTGLNDLEVRLDLDPDQIAESEDQINNSTTLRINITAGDLLPVEPYDFAITPQAAPALKASTGDPFAAPKSYIFQIDTTDTFNSPLLEQHMVTAPGGVVEWQPGPIYAINTLQDSTVFFWRCSLDSTGQGGYNWHNSSFQHLNGKQGWGQSHFFQFKDDGFNQVDYDRPDREFEFSGGSHTIGCEVTGNNLFLCQWSKDLDVQSGQGCGPFPSMNVAVVDPLDFSTWMSRYNGVGYYFGQKNADGVCHTFAESMFLFYGNNPAMMDSMANMLTNGVPDGHYILVYTYMLLNRPILDASNALGALGALGAANLLNHTVPDTVPYIFFCRKGDPASVQEIWGQTKTSMISMTANLGSSGRSGSILAPRSSSALTWEGLSWKAGHQDPFDSLRVELSGVTPQNNEQPVLQQSSYAGDIDLQPLITAAQYPRLRLKGLLWNDSAALPRPAQLERWQLLGVPAPECALDPPAGYYAHFDSLFQGQQGEVMLAVRNIGQVPMDSLLMAAWITDHNNQRHLVHYKRNAPLPVGVTLLDTIRFDTQLFPGPNSILIEANPVDTLTQVYDQPEQYHFNNIAELRFLTQQDLENPVLDVTFDGLHILDGDIVSAQPEIQVTLDDENTTLLVDQPTDTALFRVFLTDPSGTLKRIYFREGGQDVLQFVPANGPSNVSKLFWRPVFAQDGKYMLSVRASDKSHNNSGDRDNSISFEVVNKSTITSVLNYPNPFTTSTRFVFTLTGHEVPTAMQVQIMTISGRVVREVSLAELGPLHIGRNITDFAWDGTDQFGDRLARGVYLYRVRAQLHGEDIEMRESGGDQWFKKGYGKMYLLR
ncbi:MAG: C25 family cysteine peptidase [Flavobacteriales bacterium]|jgi:hypothetical protein|nr:C25 family cysteine peptidase [Flavobacteriales bacterium]